MNHHAITLDSMGLQAFLEAVESKQPFLLGNDAQAAVEACRNFLNEKLNTREAPVYGINTGFGSLCNTTIEDHQLEALQVNLMRSHACGMGSEVPAEVVRLMLVLKAKGLAYGHSGVQVATVQRLLDFYNHDCLPVVYTQGSLGASGDLAPLAHLCLPLLGEGEVVLAGKRMAANQALAQMGWSPIRLQSKEGLALLNGTQFMLAYGIYTWRKASRLLHRSLDVAALSLEAFDGRTDPFHPSLHRIRPHKGQQVTAQHMLQRLEGSQMQMQPKKAVQDPYSFRCLPQVHGASYDALGYVASVLETELNSVTDNPTVFPHEGNILSGGNFHGQPLALALDFLAIATAELGSISERRTYLLISGQRGLPPFLAPNAGLHSGFMIPQYTAASIVSQNKQLATPASVDSIVSSNGQEDHVSMGANAATKALTVVENTERILGIELMTAAQALDFRKEAATSNDLQRLHAWFRTHIPFVSEDVLMAPHLQQAARLVSGDYWPLGEVLWV
jgi:histidine ammonia-lyase